MKKITNSIAVLIIGVVLFSAYYRNSEKREVKRRLGEYLYSIHVGNKEIDKRLTKKAQTICNSFGGEGRKVRVKYDLEPLSKGWNAYTTQLYDGTYLIVTSTESEKTLYHEVAHVITFEEAAIHGPSWKMVMTKMGYPKEAARYKNNF